MLQMANDFAQTSGPKLQSLLEQKAKQEVNWVKNEFFIVLHTSKIFY